MGCPDPFLGEKRELEQSFHNRKKMKEMGEAGLGDTQLQAGARTLPLLAQSLTEPLSQV